MLKVPSPVVHYYYRDRKGKGVQSDQKITKPGDGNFLHISVTHTISMLRTFALLIRKIRFRYFFSVVH